MSKEHRWAGGHCRAAYAGVIKEMDQILNRKPRRFLATQQIAESTFAEVLLGFSQLRPGINDFKAESEILGTLDIALGVRDGALELMPSLRKCFKGDNRLYHIPRMLTQPEAAGKRFSVSLPLAAFCWL